ncbi:MAG: helix-turn-helix transcriptional regulator [Pseudoxanthomonas sp.]
MNLSAQNPGTVETLQRSLGERVARLRLSRNLTQAGVAREAGTSVSSVKRLEAGANTSLDTLLRVLAVFGLEQGLLAALPDPSVRPVERVQLHGRERQRASGVSKAAPKATDWAWGGEDDT